LKSCVQDTNHCVDIKNYAVAVDRRLSRWHILWLTGRENPLVPRTVLFSTGTTV